MLNEGVQEHLGEKLSKTMVAVSYIVETLYRCSSTLSSEKLEP